LRRGFKAQAERNAVAARRALGVSPQAPIDPWAYAEHLKVLILEIESLGLSAGSLNQLLQRDSDSWSAMTLKQGETLGIVLNSSHAITRQRSDLMHELAHIELRHVPSRIEVSNTGLLLLSDYSDEQELEADWHAGALLLPRDALLRLRSRGKTAKDIATHFGVSQSLCEWRLRMTGVEVQMRRAASF
jgi:Zn-dependent peptidase ImmA (M78 family)